MINKNHNDANKAEPVRDKSKRKPCFLLNIYGRLLSNPVLSQTRHQGSPPNSSYIVKPKFLSKITHTSVHI